MKVVSLSKAQQRIWLEWQLNAQSVAYNNPLLYELRGTLNAVCLERALQHIVNEQPGLRSYFIVQAGVPKQIITEYNGSVVLSVDDVSMYSEEVRETRLQEWITANARCRFQLTELPLFRFSLLKVGVEHYWLLLNIHHIVVDGYSARLLIQSISTYYQQFLTKQSPAVIRHDTLYADYCAAEQGSEVSESSVVFWQQQFQDANMRVDLFRSESNAPLTDSGKRQYFSISSELSQQLKQLAKQHKTTDFILLMSAFYILLRLYANQDDITIGYPLDIRPSTCRDVFGFFVNNIPLRIRLDVNQGVHALIQQINQARKQIKPHQKTDLKDIIRFVRANSSSHPDALYNVSFVRANFALSGLVLADIDVQAQLISTDAVKDELCLLFDEHQETGAFEFAIEYNKQCYASDFIQHLQTAYRLCLQAILNAPEQPIQSLSFHTHLPQSARGIHQLVTENVISQFLKQVKQSPKKMALMSTTKTLAYDALYDEVLHWCERLHTVASQDKPVIVCIARCSDLMSLMLALQWMQFTYIPVDVSIPLERLRVIIEDSAAGLCIHEGNHALLNHTCSFVTRFELKSKPIIERNTLWMDHLHHINNPIAYVIYTSGSTGTPKGVKVSRRALNNFLSGMAKHFMQEQGDLLLAITTIAFDIAGLELFLPIWQGGSVFLADQEEHKDPFKIAELLHQYPVTHLQATPAMWHMLLNSAWAGKTGLIALCGGEALSNTLAHDVLERVRQLWNMYGPTEATIWCAMKCIDKADMITVGQPIMNMNMRVLDADLNPLPPYVKGELYIGGVGLAEGYLNRPELTAERFIEYKGERLYRVGDIACTNEVGEFILFGRTDDQIKLNGYRIELGEIESRIQSIDAIGECAVVVDQNQLMAYVCLKKNQVLSESALFSTLEAVLPDYMVPKRCVFLEMFPLTTSGKLDRNALPRPPVQAQSYIQPSNSIEAQLLALWQTVLASQPMSVTDHFYRLGGHSLLVLQLTVQINTQFNSNFKLSDILNHLTIRKQAELIQRSVSETPCIVLQTQAHKAPFTPSQRRIWLTAQLMPHQCAYHMAAKLTIQGVLDIPRLEHALYLLANRHDVLRAVIEIQQGEPWQHIQATSIIPLERLYALSENEYVSWIAQPFQPNHVWWRVALHSTPKEHVVLICMHHAIADGYSVPLFLNELFAFYQGSYLPDMSHRYLDCVLFEHSKQDTPDDIAFWRTELFDSAYLELPRTQDERIDDRQSIRMTQMIDDKTWQMLQQYSAQRQVSASHVLIAAFSALMYQWTKQADFCMGVPVVQREHQAFHDKIGCFMDMLPLRLCMNKAQTFAEWIHYVQQQLLNGLSHFVPFSSLLRQLPIERHDAFAPLFPVVVNIQPNPFKDRHIDGLSVQVEPIYLPAHQYPLSLNVYFTNEAAQCHWEYDSVQFKQESIHLLVQQFSELLSRFVSLPDDMMLMEKSSALGKKMAVLTLERAVFLAPETALQKTVAQIWQTILGVPEIGLNDHFFRLGGHSFLVSKMISELTERFERGIPMALVFRHSTLIDFCVALEDLFKQNIKSMDFDAPLELTPNQKQMILALKEKPQETYHVSVLLTRSHWDIERLEFHLNELMMQHSVFGLYLVSSMTLVHTTSPKRVAIDVIDILPSQSIYHLAQQSNQVPIDLHEAPLFRASLFKGDEEALLIKVHHMIADEWALQMFINALLLRYEGQSNAKIISCWQQHAPVWLHPDANAVQYWQHYISTFQPSIVPPTQQNARSSANRGVREIAASSISYCESLAQRHGSTLFHVMLSVFIYFVRQMTRERCVAIAVTHDRRHNKTLRELQGYLVNLLPLVCEVDGFLNWSELLEWTKMDQLQALEQGHVDYAYLLAQGLTALPKIVFNYQHEVQEFASYPDLKWHEVHSQQARFPITCHARKTHQGGMGIVIEYDTAIYHAEFIETILDAFVQLIQRLPTQSQLPLRNWSYGIRDRQVPPLKRDAIDFLQYPGMDIDYQCIKRPRELLWQHVSQFAQVLLTDQMLQCGDVVGLACRDRYAYLVSLLAVLRVGAVFLPIDVNLPIERQQLIIEDSRARLLIDDDCFQKWINTSTGLVERHHVDDQVPAYIIYTSGTTGLPKGTVISRRALQTFITGLQDRLQLKPSDRVLHFSSPSFDASIWEIFLALISGASLIIPDEHERRVGEPLEQFMQKQGVTHAILTPSVLSQLKPAAIPSLRCVASGGEPCTANLIAQWAQHCDFYNAYGPTEATVCVALKQFTAHSQPNCIGHALGEAKLSVVSNTLMPVPIGVMGELLIGGPILAEHYLNQPELSEQRFVMLEGVRWYRTGDIVRQMPSLEFEFIGREDGQIKLRGLRIELGEIEVALCTVDYISSACCIVEHEQLIAYVTAHQTPNEMEILAQLAKKLPHYMLPTRVIQMPVFPLLPSGKIDVKALPRPVTSPMEITLPSTPQEHVVSTIWSRYLNQTNIDIHQDFFRLGGNSLQAMGISADLERQFSIHVSLQFFYTHSTIAKQSEYIAQEERVSQSMDDWLSQLSETEKQALLESLTV